MSNENDSGGADNGTRLSVVWRASEFVRAVTSALWSLRGADLLTDVTLSCVDGSVRAHRVLLAACSPYLRNLFKDNPCQHPILIFRDISHVDLAALLHFMYHGEVSVPQQRLASFLSAADLLQVRGLTQETANETHTPDNTPKEDRDVKCVSPKPKRRRTFSPTTVVDDSLEIQNPSSVCTENTIEPTTLEYANICDSESVLTDSDLKPKSLDPDNISKDSSTDFTLPLDNLSEETNQDGDEVKFRCQLCLKSFKHPISLSLHKDSHAGKTQCPICHRFFSRSYDMRCHLTKIHQDQPPEIKLKVTKSSLENNT
ncbi:uncharacterized protein LOC143911023 [Arctopsyche grandis]|uniref:uncharacterized protein LOC143911023 n=1 Tax=Arctopsyche grandis TaxID=121162 RepID=UPI00406D9ADF